MGMSPLHRETMRYGHVPTPQGDHEVWGAILDVSSLHRETMRYGVH